jgi:hypothetical protein
VKSERDPLVSDLTQNVRERTRVPEVRRDPGPLQSAPAAMLRATRKELDRRPPDKRFAAKLPTPLRSGFKKLVDAVRKSR